MSKTFNPVTTEQDYLFSRARQEQMVPETEGGPSDNAVEANFALTTEEELGIQEELRLRNLGHPLIRYSFARY